MAKLTRAAALALGLGALAATAAVAQRDPSRFTFPYVAHIDVRTGNYDAKQFVEKELPAGLPMAEAVARVRAARASCRGGMRGGGGEVICRYSISDAGDGASLAQEVWTLTLTPGPGDKLAGAAIDRRRTGLPGELGTRAVFHWELGE